MPENDNTAKTEILDDLFDSGSAATPAVASENSGRRPMRGTAIAWGIILLLVAAFAYFTSTVDVWQADSRTLVTTIVLLGAVLVGIGIVGAIVRAVTRR